MTALPRYITPLELGDLAEDAPAVIVEVTDDLGIHIYQRNRMNGALPLLSPLVARQLGQAVLNASAWAGQRRAQRRTR